MKTIHHPVSAVADILHPAGTSDAAALMTPAQAAIYLGVEMATLAVWRCTGRYPLPYFKVGRLVRYRKGDLDAFLAGRRIESTHRAGA